MASTLVKIYDSLSSAEGARNALLASGFEPDNVHIDAKIDEAGPASGDFVAEYKDTDKGGDDSPFDRLLGGDDPNEGLGRTPVEWHGSFLLTVDADSEEQIVRASDIMDRFGAVDADRAPRSTRMH